MADKDFPIVGAFMVPHPPIILPEVGQRGRKKDPGYSGGL